MVARAFTVAFEGVEARMVEVQCSVTAGLPAFRIVYTITLPISSNCVRESITPATSTGGG
jgi:hypothetical protein